MGARCTKASVEGSRSAKVRTIEGPWPLEPAKTKQKKAPDFGYAKLWTSARPSTAQHQSTCKQPMPCCDHQTKRLRLSTDRPNT